MITGKENLLKYFELTESELFTILDIKKEQTIFKCINKENSKSELKDILNLLTADKQEYILKSYNENEKKNWKSVSFILINNK